MSRYFSVYPDGSVGTGLLVLRASLLPILWAPVYDDVTVRLCFATAAIPLLLGSFTRIAATGLVVLTVGTTLWALWNGAPPLFGTLPTQLMVAAVSASLALVGPGAYSIDARRFGWQELTVPHE